MNCKIGDKVRFLSDVGGGIVVGFENQYTALVRDNDGFEIPTPISDLVVVNFDEPSGFFADEKEKNNDKISEYTKREVHKVKCNIISDNVTKISKLVNTDSNNSEYSFLLGFVPIDADNMTDSDLNIYLINDCFYRAFYIVGRRENNKIIPLKTGEIDPDSKEFICSVKKTDINLLATFHIDLLLFKNTEYLPIIAQQTEIELNPIKLVKQNSFTDNDFFEEKAFIYALLNSEQKLSDFLDIDAKKIEKEINKKKGYENKPTKTIKKNKVEEVDLHIDSIVDNFSGMSNGEILKIQIDRFTTALDLGIASKTGRIVFIHGVGNGRLKHEMHRLLDTQYSGRVRYQDASFKEYGYGATLVLIK